MSSVETVLTVILIAISINLVLAIAILVSRWRASANARTAAAARGPRATEAGRVPVFTAAQDSSATDFQTGLDGAGTWDRWLDEEEARVKRYHRPATIVLIELQGLDRLIERLGPVVADRLIPPVATTLRRHARQSDRIARLGRARFGAILVETGEVEAINYVERVRSAADLWLASGAVSLRLSIGWAEVNAGRDVDRAVDAAEARLHEDRRREHVADPPLRMDAPLTEPAAG